MLATASGGMLFDMNPGFQVHFELKSKMVCLMTHDIVCHNKSCDIHLFCRRMWYFKVILSSAMRFLSYDLEKCQNFLGGFAPEPPLMHSVRLRAGGRPPRPPRRTHLLAQNRLELKIATLSALGLQNLFEIL